MFIIYLLLLGTGISFSLLMILLAESYKMTKAQKQVKAVEQKVDYDIGLSRWELHKITRQVLAYDKNRIKRGYRW